MKLVVERGFTIVELMVAIAILGILFSVGLTNIPGFNSQMKASEEVRRLALNFNSLRNEAIRLRSNVRLTFTSTGYTWDINDDGSTEGTQNFSNGSSWSTTTPSPILINGLGLARGIAGSQTYSINNGGVILTLQINSNGFVSF